MTFIDDNEIDPEIPVQWIKDKMQNYKIVGGGLDSYRYSILKKPLAAIGFDCDKKGKNNIKLCRPSDIMQIAPTITRAFANHNLIWDDDALMRWFTNNVAVVYDKKGNMQFEKIEAKSRKTDGFFALTHAFTQNELLDKYSPNKANIMSEIMDVYTY